MSLRTLSVAPPLVSLFFFSTFVVAGVNVTATCISSTWTFNSIGQSPCIVAAFMLATCYSGSYTLPSLPPGYAYGGPTRDASNKCECSTVGYSLVSACVTCQERSPFNWSQYTINCTSVLPPSQFPNPVPAGIYVPHWAILDVTNENAWDANASYAAGDGPEYGPGAIFGAEGVSTSSSSSSTSSASATRTSSSASASISPTASSSPSHSKSNSHAGVIAGSVIGGIVVLAFIVIAGVILRRHLQRTRSQAASADGSASQPMLVDGMIPVPQSSPGPPPAPVAFKLYDPNDPTTFPENQGGPGYLSIPPTSTQPSSSHLTLPPRVGSNPSGTTLAGTQISLPLDGHANGYRGLPMPHS